jgi:hypothetical protein
LLFAAHRARGKETEKAMLRSDWSPRGQARIDVISKATNYWTDTAALFANDNALCVGAHPTT